MRILGPKYVKKAKLWCVTHFKNVAQSNTKKVHGGQEISWFNTAEEAQKYIDSIKE